MCVNPVSVGPAHHIVDETGTIPRVLDTDHLHTGQVHLVSRRTLSIHGVAVKLTLRDSELLDFTRLDGVRRVDDRGTSVRRVKCQNALSLNGRDLMGHAPDRETIIHAELILETGRWEGERVSCRRVKSIRG